MSTPSDVLYKMTLPKELGYGLQKQAFYIPATDAGYETASVMHGTDKDKRLKIFKHAQKLETRDLSKAYVDLKETNDDIDREQKRRQSYMPDPEGEGEAEVELEPAIEKDIAKRNEEAKELAEETKSSEGDVYAFKTWLDD